MRLKPKIMLAVVLPLLIGVVVMVVITSVFVSQVSDYLVDQSQSQIVVNQQQSLTRRAQDKANLIQEYAALVTSDMAVLNSFATAQVNGQINASVLPSYYSFGVAGPSSPFEGSVWYQNDISNVNQATQVTKNEVDTTSIIDIHFRSVILANPNYVYVQIGFKADGLFRVYPYQDMSTYPSRYAICEATGQYITGYDPRCRVWFTAGQLSPAIHFTAPYITSTASKDLVVAVTQGVKQNDDLYMVIALNFKVGALENSILGTTFLDSGYAYVIDWNASVVFHPNIKDRSKAVPSLLELEFNNNLEDYNKFRTLILDDMVNLGNGTTTFTKQGRTWYISYAPAPSARYSLAIVVPADEVLAPVDHFRSRTNKLLGTQIGVFVAVIFVTVVILFIVISFVSAKAVKPVKQLTELCRQITRGDLNYDLAHAPKSSKEISAMYVTFGHLLTALRFGNDDFYKGNQEKAMANYLSALSMFTQFENKKGMGICYNNIGNIHRARGEYEQAEKLYGQAIEFGIALNDPPTVESQRSLSSRYNNMAMLYIFQPVVLDVNGQVVNDRSVEAEQYLHKALELDNHTLDYVSMISHFGNLALLALKQNLVDRAAGYMAQVDDVMHQAHPPTSELQQKYEHIRMMFSEAARNPGAFTNTARPKDVFFLLDSSGSMSGAKNKSSVNGMRTIFQKNVGAADRVCLITFSSQHRIVFPLTQKGPQADHIEHQFNRLAAPEGGTAFFDALGAAYKLAAENPSKNEQWIVALTDGDDNQSKVHSAETVQRLAHLNSKITLIIIVVGTLESREKLQSISAASEKGKLMDIDDKDGVGNAIGKAFEEIGSMMDAGVETYNFKSDE